MCQNVFFTVNTLNFKYCEHIENYRSNENLAKGKIVKPSLQHVNLDEFL